LKIGIIGLGEPEWLETLTTIDYHDVIYEPFIDVGRELAHELRTVDVSLNIYPVKNLLDRLKLFR